MKKILSVVFPLLLVTNIFSQGLSENEKKIIAYVNQHMNEAENLLIKSVNINSGTLNKEGVKKVGDLFSVELEKAGLKTEWINLPDSLHRAGHLVASRQGKKGK